MTTGRKTIKKPSFIITYSISFVIVFLVLGCIGLLIYSKAEDRYQAENIHFRLIQENDMTDKIIGYFEKERVTQEDIVNAKIELLSHYTDTAQYAQVWVNGKLLVDAGQTAFLRYVSESGQCYMLELSDNKYLKFFDVPESKDLQCLVSYTEDGMQIMHQPAVAFECSEFYADYTNFRFIPSTYRLIFENGEYGPEVRISLESKDIEGYMLVRPANDKTNGNVNDTTHGLIEGYSGEINEVLLTGSHGVSGEDVQIEIKTTHLSLPSFSYTYGTYILIGICLWEVCSLLFALIPASVKYNTDKRNYEIYEHRRQTTNAMAHDLKTPLASIIAYTEILNNNIDVANREHYLTKISDTASQMNSIVNGILQFSRSENATAPVNKSEVAVPELISGIIDENEQQISEKALKVDFDNTEELKLNTDKELLHQALGNLINNAVKYAKEGTTVQIKYSAETITITNEPAEPIENITNVKEPFIKGNSSRQNGGTGLGLAIADNDLVMLGYKLDVRMEDGRFVATVKI